MVCAVCLSIFYMETFSMLLAFFAGNVPLAGGFLGLVTQSFDVLYA